MLEHIGQLRRAANAQVAIADHASRHNVDKPLRNTPNKPGDLRYLNLRADDVQDHIHLLALKWLPPRQ
ncbi:MAG: hypothetical protein L6Q76_06490 [Polyangiaceae bacterium]|nr:hypothetical protein [Polyangiaceae bacterium]